MNQSTEYHYKKLLNNYSKEIYKKWQQLPFGQSECGKLVRSNFRNVKNKKI